MKKILLYFLIAFPFLVNSQNIEDALRFSRTENFSTARSMGVAGAFGAMGADFGAISYNPATLGNYWKSEMVFSLGSQKTKTNADLENNKTSDNKRSFTFDNIGFVSNWGTISPEKIESHSFAIGLNNTASYSYNLFSEGNHKGSILENKDLFSDINFSTYTDYSFNKKTDISESGTQRELLFAYGRNYKDRFLWGISLGIPFINYNTERDYVEKAPSELLNNSNLDFYFNEIHYSSGYSTVGVGLNLKGGVIVKLPAGTRAGLSIHTPTYLRLKDDYYEYLNVYPINGWIFDTIDYDGYFDYNMKTPLKIIGSLGKVFGNEKFGGFINIDAEYSDNPGMKFNFTKYSDNADDEKAQKEINDKIAKDLKGAFNIRIGGELAVKKLRLRAGTAVYDSPFKSDSDYNPALIFSGGIGYRGEGFYIDLAYVHSSYSYGYYPYVAADKSRSPRIDIDKTIDKFNATIGLKF